MEDVPDKTIQSPPPPPLTTTQKRVLAVFSAVGSVLRATRSAGVCRDTHYRWMRESPLYKAGFEESREHVAQMLEDEAIRRAVQGETRPERYKGRIVGWVTTRDTPLLQMLLRANNPNRFGDKSKIEHTGKDGDPLFPITVLNERIRKNRAARDAEATDGD